LYHIFKSYRNEGFCSNIAVQAGEYIIHAEVSENGSQKADNRNGSRTAALPAHDDSGMKIESEYEPGDQTPRLLGIPAPVGSPGLVSPDHAEDQSSQREQGKADGDAPVADGIELLGSETGFFRSALLLFRVSRQVHDAGDKSDSKEGFPDIWELPGHGWHENLLKDHNRWGPRRLTLWPPPFPEAVPGAFCETPEDEFRVNKVFLDRASETDKSFVSLIWHPWSLAKFDPDMKMLELTFAHVRRLGLKPCTYAQLYADVAG